MVLTKENEKIIRLNVSPEVSVVLKKQQIKNGRSDARLASIAVVCVNRNSLFAVAMLAVPF